jgi:hypothetical protein
MRTILFNGLKLAMKTIYENNSVQSVQVREIFGIGTTVSGN